MPKFDASQISIPFILSSGSQQLLYVDGNGVSGSFVGDGSKLTNIPTQNIDTSSLATTASLAGVYASQSFYTPTSSFNYFTSSYNTGSFKGNLQGTASLSISASWAPYQASSSYSNTSLYAATASHYEGSVNSASYASTASLSIQALSASYSLQATSASWAPYQPSSSYSFTSSVTPLQSSLLTNQTVGGLTSGTPLSQGTSIESILRSILVTYIPPTLSSLVMKSGGSSIPTSARDVGNAFTANSASFNATADNPNGVYPISSSFTGSNADIGTVSYYFGNNVLGSSNTLPIGGNYSFSKSSAGSITFTVNGKRSDTNATITATTTSIAFQFRNYLGASSTIVTDNTSAQTIVNSAVTSTLASSKSWTATCTSANDTTGNYTYIIYPASYGDLSNVIQNGALSVLSAFTKIGDFTVSNAYSISLSFRVYKSNSDKAFANGTTLAIS